MATKTIAIPEDVHQTITEVQLDIRKKYGISLKLSYIVTAILKKYARTMEDILKEGFNEQSDQEEDIGLKIEGDNKSLLIEGARP